jgi:hypothetical protein
MVDKYWYRVQETHGNWKWKSKMLFSIMRFAVFDVWVYFTQVQYEKWADFRKYLAKELYDF